MCGIVFYQIALESMLNREEQRIPHARPKPRAGSNRHEPGGPHRIFNFEIRKEPLIIAELTVK